MKAKLVMFLAGLALTGSASALTISPTGDLSGGTPGGLTIYQVGLDASDVGQSFSLDWAWKGFKDDVSATGVMSILRYDIGTGEFDLGVSLTNTSTVTAKSNPRILAFGFNVDPDLLLTGLTDSSGIDSDKLDDTRQYVNFPGYSSIDVCAFSARRCSGGAVNTGLASGETDEFVLHFIGDLSGGLTLDTFAMKFQGNNSFELPGQPTCTSGNCIPVLVPVPSTILLMGMGLLGLAGMRRSRLI